VQDIIEDRPDAPAEVLEVLNERYALERLVGKGSQGQAYVARDLTDDARVLVKEMRMNQVEEWKAVELFEREAQALESITHEAIPAFIEAFHTASDEDGMRFFLVQEFIDGEDLQALIDGGLMVDEAGARAFLRELLGILDFLHTREIPVIHRDIKPANIIRRKDGRLVLIDFGGVQSTLGESSQKTVVGTSGYMPMEQLMGRALPASDLYALAATVVHLLSRRHPSELPVVGMQLEFQDFINVSDHFEATLEKMLSAHAEDRFQSTEEVLSFLDSTPEMAATSSAPQSAPRGSLARSHRGGVQFERPDEDNPEFFHSWSVQSGRGDPAMNKAHAAVAEYISACKRGSGARVEPPPNLPPPRHFVSKWKQNEDGFKLISREKHIIVTIFFVGFISVFLMASISSVFAGLNAQPVDRLAVLMGSLMAAGASFFGIFAIAGATGRIEMELRDNVLRVRKRNWLRTNYDERIGPGAKPNVIFSLEQSVGQQSGGTYLHLPYSTQVDPKFAAGASAHEQLYIRQEMNRYFSQQFANASEDSPA